MKPREEVVPEFNDLVNMTADELEAWLKSDDSRSAGWPKDEDNDGGESVGHDSGRKIVEILRSNPNKDPEKYSDEQVDHMRKVVAYNKRHIAQESGSNAEKSPEEVKKTKSYASLKNWGHDILRSQGREEESGGGGDSNSKGASKSNGTSQKSKKTQKKGEREENDEDGAEDDEEYKEEEGDEEEGEEEEDDEEGGEPQAGDKRKKSEGQNGTSKKRETRQGKGQAANNDSGKNESKEEDDGEEEDEEDGEDGGAKPKKGPKPGEKVSWDWGGGQPEGKVLDVKGEKTSVETKNGNTVSRHGDPEDPAVVLDTGKSKAVKANHELN